MGLLERKARDFKTPDIKNPMLIPTPDARRGSIPDGKIDYAMRLTDSEGRVYDHAGNPLPREVMPTFNMPHALESAEKPGTERESRLQYVSNESRGMISPASPNTNDPKNKDGFMYKFYKALKDRRENPQSKGKFAFDLGLEVVGIPLAGIAAAVGLEPLVPFLLPYTTGDVINIIEAIWGRTFGGKKLTLFERGLYILGGVLPVIPGRALVSAWEKIEDETIYPALRNHFEGKQPSKK